MDENPNWRKKGGGGSLALKRKLGGKVGVEYTWRQPELDR